jgi:toxin ParE1/3/4
MTSISTHPKALDEFRAATLYYLDQNPSVAAEFVDAYDLAVNLIAKSPESYPVVTRSFRRKLLKKFPFSIYYLSTKTEIRIIAVTHQSRRPFYWSSRS